MARIPDTSRSGAHLCRCSECGAQHLRPKPMLVRYCAQCFELLPPSSRAKYCGSDCRRAARDVSADPRPAHAAASGGAA